MRRTSRRILGLRWYFLLVVFISLSPLVKIARADGGVVIFQRALPPFTITLFSEEMPLRPGPADLSVFLEQPDGHSPILDARVFITLQHENGTIIRSEATRKQARNKLLYCSLITFSKSGHWKMMLHVVRGDEKADISYDLVVTVPPLMLLSNWKLISLPPVIIILFMINQWLRKNASTGRSHRKDQSFRKEGPRFAKNEIL